MLHKLKYLFYPTHYKITANGTTKYSKCSANVRPHRVCAACGTSKGKEVIKEEKATETE